MSVLGRRVLIWVGFALCRGSVLVESVAQGVRGLHGGRRVVCGVLTSGGEIKRKIKDEVSLAGLS